MNHAKYCSQFIPTTGKILDVGSGNGKFLCAMAKSGFDIFGIELNAKYIDKAYETANEQQIKINIKQARAEKLPFTDSYFDFINCAEVSEHVEDPVQMCREIYRVLRSDGRCYISFHNRFSIYDYHYHLYFINWLPRSWTELLLKWLKKNKQDSSDIGRQKLATMHYYTYDQVKIILSKIGFQVNDIREDKIKQKFGKLAIFFLLPYFLILRPFYFNSFHILLEKKKC